MLAIHELEQAGRIDAARIEKFLNENTFPLIEGTKVTFAYRGQAEEVLLRHWVYGLPEEQHFQRLHDSDLWFLVMDLPAKSRMEYKLEVVQHGQRRLVHDALNPKLASDPYGANSVVHGDGYEIAEWAVEDPEARPGKIVEHRFSSDVLHGPRPVKVYLPARFRERQRYPLLVVHDGSDYLRFSDLKVVLDNLIHRLEIPSMIVALTDSPNRLEEYVDEERHAKFITQELVPLLESKYPLVAKPLARGIMGASFGALASLSTAWRYPGYFGNLLVQSGSFAFTDIGEHDRGPLFDHVVEFVNAFRAAPGKPAQRVFQTCGTYESMIYYNRSMVPLFQSTGMDVNYVESRDGHNWENWRDRLREGLSWLFPGPLWMVYE